MNLNQLEYFVCVAEDLNFTKAAKRCFITQTAMTQQIRSLEEKIGVPLLLRDKHHVELTAAGRIYLEKAKEILSQSNEAIRMARMASEGIQGELTIGYVKGYGQTDFAIHLRAFHNSFPNIKVNLIRDNQSPLMEKLGRGECDVAMAIAPFMQEYPHLEHMKLHQCQVMAVLYPGHRLEKHAYLTYPELEGEDFIMMQPSDRQKDQMEESMLIYKRGGYLPKVIGVEGDQETLMLMVAAGMGISLIPAYIARLYQSVPELRILPMVKEDGSAETLDFEISWLPENTNPAVFHFLDIVKHS